MLPSARPARAQGTKQLDFGPLHDQWPKWDALVEWLGLENPLAAFAGLHGLRNASETEAIADSGEVIASRASGRRIFEGFGAFGRF